MIVVGSTVRYKGCVEEYKVLEVCEEDNTILIKGKGYTTWGDMHQFELVSSVLYWDPQIGDWIPRQCDCGGTIVGVPHYEWCSLLGGRK